MSNIETIDLEKLILNENIIDYDHPEINNKFLDHLHNDHKFVFYRKSCSNNYHIVTEGPMCFECIKYCDYKYWNMRRNSCFTLLFDMRHFEQQKATYWDFYFTTDHLVKKNNLSLNDCKKIFEKFKQSFQVIEGYYLVYTKKGHGQYIRILKDIFDIKLIRDDPNFKEIKYLDYCSFTNFSPLKLEHNKEFFEKIQYNYCITCSWPDFECHCEHDDYDDDYDYDEEECW